MEGVKLLKHTVRALSLRYNALKKISALMGNSESAADYLDKTLSVLMKLSGAPAGVIIIRSAGFSAASFKADIPAADADKCREKLKSSGVEPGPILSGVLSGTSKFEYSEDISDEPAYRKALKEALGEIDNITIFPLKSGNRVMGAVELFNIPGGLPGDDRKQALVSAGAHIGMALEIFRRIGSLKERTDSLRKLSVITEAVSSARRESVVFEVIMKHALSFFGAEGCSILTKDDEGRAEFTAVSGSKAGILRGKKLSKGEGIAGWVIEKGRPLLVGNVAKDERFSPRADSMTRMISGSIICAPLMVAEETVGAVEIVRSREKPPFTRGDLEMLTVLSSHAALAVNKARIFTRKDRWLNSVIELITRTVDVREKYFPGQTDKVREYARLIAQEMGFSEEDIQFIDIAAAVQNIGKLVIPESILSKEGELSEEEWKVIKTYPRESVRILESVNEFKKLIPAVMHHRENYDGTGYPDSLKGEAIPLEARILAVADAYAALTGKRPYREALDHARAVEIIKSRSGTQFDPEVVTAFLKNQPGNTS